MSTPALNSYNSAEDALSAIWDDYHVLFDLNMNFQRLRDCHPDIYNRRARLFRCDPKEIKGMFYREIRKKSVIKRLRWSQYLNEVRFSAFSDIFYGKTGVCVEFLRRKLCKMLK
jgi:hypothetical protein